MKTVIGFSIALLLATGIAVANPTVPTTKFRHPINSNGGNIQAGAGYSNDAQQIALQPCFNGKITSQSEPQNFFKLSSNAAFDELETILKIDVSSSANIGIFSGDAEVSYLKDVQDKDYSLSLNYYQGAESRAAVEVSGRGLNALTDSGKEMYDNGKNPYFGLLCGDSYITSYAQGAMLLMALNINFASHYEKEQFQLHAGASWGDMISASAEITRIATENHIRGSVVIEAYQMGGNPERLAKVLSKDPSGQYYALSCDLQNMDKCKLAASGLLDYVHDDFPTQFSFQQEKGLTPLGLGFTEYRPIRYLNLIPAPSLVTPQVKQDRIDLYYELKKYDYYRQKFGELLYGYPVAWNTNSDIYKGAQKLYQQAGKNINTILSPANPEQGARGCFDTPDQCEEITANIKMNVMPITDKDLSVLDDLKFFMPINVNVFLTTINDTLYKAGDTDSSWKHAGSWNFTSIDLNNTKFSFNSTLSVCNVWYTGASSDATSYVGDVHADGGIACRKTMPKNVKFTKQQSPFYFTAYKP